MRKVLFSLIVIVAMIVLPVLEAASSSPPPPPPGGPAPGDIPIGGSAPVGSGLVLLLSMGAAYGAKKLYDARKKLEE